MRFKLPSYNNTSTPPIDILSSTNTTYRWNHGGLLARYRPCVLTFIRRSSQQCVRSLFLLLLQSSTSAAPLGNVCLSSPRQSRSALHKLGSKASRKKGIPPTSTTAAALNSWQLLRLRIRSIQSGLHSLLTKLLDNGSMGVVQHPQRRNGRMTISPSIYRPTRCAIACARRMLVRATCPRVNSLFISVHDDYGYRNGTAQWPD